MQPQTVHLQVTINSDMYQMLGMDSFLRATASTGRYCWGTY